MEDGYRLGSWVSVQRLNKDGISHERRQRLADLGFVWDPHGTAWEEGFKHLQAFVEEHKHCRVPTNYKSTNGYTLGRWIAQQRRTRDALSIERKTRLDALGFVWNVCPPGSDR
jgi:hypothetical protein